QMSNMTPVSIPLDIQELLNSWIKAEQNGIQFPVPFENAWRIAGYSRKDSAKRCLPKSSRDRLFHVYVEKSTGGRPKETIKLSTDGLKHLCLMADTSEGDAIRQYFIEVEKKWKVVERIAPNVASEAELMNSATSNEINPRSEIDFEFERAVHIAEKINRTTTISKAVRRQLIEKVYADAGIDLTLQVRQSQSSPGGESHLTKFIEDIQLVQEMGSIVELRFLWEQLKLWYFLNDLGQVTQGDIVKPCGALVKNSLDPVVASKRLLRSRLQSVCPEAVMQSIPIQGRGNARKSALIGWIIRNPLEI
ncbi:MAG: hypothetical protein AAGA75_20715, partial [Cyanobacteria bacterium P01_E01_bin.6]